MTFVTADGSLVLSVDGLDDLELMDPDGIANGGSFCLSVIADGSTFGGGGSPVVQTINSRLYDGSVVKYDHSENRELTFVVEVTGPDLAACAEGEAALVSRLYRSADLVWTPPDGFGTPGRFEVWTSESKYLDNDLDMVRQSPRMTYTLSFTCAPWATSVAPVTSEALPVPGSGDTPSTVLVSDGSSSTGWSRSQGPATWDLTGVIGTEYTAATATAALAVAYEGSTVVGSNGYLVVDYVRRVLGSSGSVASSATPPVAILNNGQRLTALSVVPSPVSYPAGYEGLRAWFRVPSSVTTLTRSQFELTQQAKNQFILLPLSSTFQFGVDSFALTNVPPAVGTPRQQTRTVEVPGSVRTQSSLRLWSPSTALGDTFVMTWRDDGSGYQPPIRRWALATPETHADASTVSGFYQSTAGSAFVAEVPVRLVPRGLTHLYARVRRQGGDGSAQLTWEVRTELDGVQLAPSATGTYTRNYSGDWDIIPLGRCVARAVKVKDNSAAVVRVAFISTALDVDEVWMANVDREVGVGGAVTVVGCGDAKLLALEAPTSADPYPKIFLGADPDDESTWFHANDDAIRAFGMHESTPPAINLMFASEATDARAEQVAYSRWHTFPAA